MIPIHERKEIPDSFSRLDMLWDRYPRHHEMSTFSTLDSLLEEHESYRQDFDDLCCFVLVARCGRVRVEAAVFIHGGVLIERQERVSVTEEFGLCDIYVIVLTAVLVHEGLLELVHVVQHRLVYEVQRGVTAADDRAGVADVPGLVRVIAAECDDGDIGVQSIDLFDDGAVVIVEVRQVLDDHVEPGAGIGRKVAGTGSDRVQESLNVPLDRDIRAVGGEFLLQSALRIAAHETVLFDGVDPGDEVEPGVIDADVQGDEVSLFHGFLIGGTPVVQDFFVVPAEGHVPGLRLEDPVALVAVVQEEPEFIGPEVRDTHLVQGPGADRFGDEVGVCARNAASVLDELARFIVLGQTEPGPAAVAEGRIDEDLKAKTVKALNL